PPSQLLLLSFPIILPPPPPTLFPYTTLFRSGLRSHEGLLLHLLARLEARLGAFSSGTGEGAGLGVSAQLVHQAQPGERVLAVIEDRKSTRLNSSHRTISYAVFCLKKKKNIHV